MSSASKYSSWLPDVTGFDPIKVQAWVSDCFGLSILSSVIYVIAVFLGQRWMTSRPALNLRPALVVWNASLAVLSAVMCSRFIPELLYVLRDFGWRHSVCSFSYYDGSPVNGFWSYLFLMSKLAELLDTLFLVLRKRKVTFLHWFHHCSVLIHTWFMLKDKSGPGRWYMNINAAVHSVMYTYYALMALRVKLPRLLPLCVTSLQMAQMIMGTLVSLQGAIYWSSGVKCNVSATAILFSVFIYGVYFSLFLHFFITKYLTPRTMADKKKGY